MVDSLIGSLFRVSRFAFRVPRFAFRVVDSILVDPVNGTSLRSVG